MFISTNFIDLVISTVLIVFIPIHNTQLSSYLSMLKFL